MTTETTPCLFCATPTEMLGTKLCDPCWNLRTAISYRKPDVIARVIVAVCGAVPEVLAAIRDALTAAIDAPRLAALASASSDRTARGVTLYRAPQPFTADSVTDEVASVVAEAFDEHPAYAAIEQRMRDKQDRIAEILAETWGRIVDEVGLTVEVEAATLTVESDDGAAAVAPLDDAADAGGEA